jgi:hypothetical protein
VALIVFVESGARDQVCTNFVMRGSLRCSDARPLVGGQCHQEQMILQAVLIRIMLTFCFFFLKRASCSNQNNQL